MACTCTVGTIDEFCGGLNAPGLERVIPVTCTDQVETIPSPGTGTHVISTNITMRASAVGPPAVTAGKFYKWPIAPTDMSYSCERDENGMYKTEVKAFVQKMEAEKSYVLNGMTGDNCLALVPDKNGITRLVGSKTNGCSVRYKATTNPKNGYELTISWESAHEPYVYTGTVTY